MEVKQLVIGTRGSNLALAQAEQVAAMLREHHPGLSVELNIIKTKGDHILDVALSAVGDKGLFVKEIEVALLNGEVDLAVHSGKDLPSVIPDGLILTAFPKRVDPRDVIILPQQGISPSSSGSSEPPSVLPVLPMGARVGTSSLRRSCQIRALRPDLELLDVRGNVNTRLSKLDGGEYDALLLASAGLERLGLGDRRSEMLPIEIFLPAVSQGALIIEAREHDTQTLQLLSALNDEETHVTVQAERAFLHRLEGGCQVPIAAYAQLQGENVFLRGLVGSLDGKTIIRGERTGPASDPKAVGIDLAEELIGRGADTILADLRTSC